MSENFFTSYFRYSSGNEVPIIAHRWSAITSIGALLAKSVHVQFGTKKLYPNIYCILIGTSGSKKSTGITMFRDKVLLPGGYHSIAASKTTKEKYLMDLAGIDVEIRNGKELEILDRNLFGGNSGETTENFIVADELNDFFGNNNLEFISLLGSLWDIDRDYENRVKNGKSFVIPNPTISILGGNTPIGFAKAFPPEIIGQGFFSRVFWIYCQPKGVKITWPRVPSVEEDKEILVAFQRISSVVKGRLSISPTAEKLLDKIYHSWKGVHDARFESYSTRRFPHLLKLCIIHTLGRYSATMEEQDVIYTNTILSYAEHFMPKALGEFGKAKNSDINHKVLSLIEAARFPIKLKEIWVHVNTDLEKLTQLADIIGNLTQAGKIQVTKDGFLPMRAVIGEEDVKQGVVDFSLLTQEERNMI